MTTPDITSKAGELLPCPFCGGTDLNDRGDNAIWCKNIKCDAFIDIGHSIGPSARRDVAERWNRRALSRTEAGGEPVAWRKAMRELVFAARTSGGTAGRDEELCAACDRAEELLRYGEGVPAAGLLYPTTLSPVPAGRGHSSDGGGDECPICGGEGFVFDCFDGCCLDADVGCDDCTRPCECNRHSQASPELQQVLADALAKHKATQ